MDIFRACNYIENSFLKPLLADSNVTDISYNGDSIFYMDNLHGRRLSDIRIDYLQAKDFIRQIANLTEKQFSYSNPTLDVSFGRYRINALHNSVAKRGNEDVLNFSIRIASGKLRITKESGFMPDVLIELFDILLKSKASLVLGGQTGCGKTEFQKYLLSQMEENTRVIVIDNVLELDSLDINKGLDLNVWQANENKIEVNFQSLIKNALRSNPDWLIAAEARGEEMVDVLNSALTGHPIITTIHAFSCESMPDRMTQMVMMGNKKTDYNEIYRNISYHMRFYVYLKRETKEDGKVIRYISEIGYMDETKMHKIYEFNEEHKYYKFPDGLKKFIKFKNVSNDFKERFLN